MVEILDFDDFIKDAAQRVSQNVRRDSNCTTDGGSSSSLLTQESTTTWCSGSIVSHASEGRGERTLRSALRESRVNAGPEVKRQVAFGAVYVVPMDERASEIDDFDIKAISEV
mmetsp:Transcript_11488/g.26022  ORF Transcript_11488/g.26022 Transcript_11488/m.26022 type:complete len:113 (+) Transcript_11488:47-385(+)